MSKKLWNMINCVRRTSQMEKSSSLKSGEFFNRLGDCSDNAWSIRNQTQKEHHWQQNRLAAKSTSRWLYISYGNCMTKVCHILPFQGRSNRMSKEERKSLHKLMSHPCCHRSWRVVATWNVLSNSWKHILSGSPPEPTLSIPTRGMFISSIIITNWSNKNGWNQSCPWCPKLGHPSTE